MIRLLQIWVPSRMYCNLRLILGSYVDSRRHEVKHLSSGSFARLFQLFSLLAMVLSRDSHKWKVSPTGFISFFFSLELNIFCFISEGILYVPIFCVNIKKRISGFYLWKMFSLPCTHPVNFILIMIFLYSHWFNSGFVLWYLWKNMELRTWF